SATEVAFFDRAGVSHVEGVPGVFRVNVESVDVVEPAVPGFGDDGQRPPVALHIGRAMFHFPCDDGVADDTNAVRVGDHDRAIQEAGIVDPGGTSHFAVAVESEPSGEYGVVGSFAAGWMAVTPVRTGPLPTTSLPLPEMSVVWPTSTPLTSVMALLGPGVPSKGTPRSRARGLDCAEAATARVRIARRTR